MKKLNKLVTESRNDASKDIDKLSTLEMLQTINAEDKKVALAVEKELEQIAKAVDLIAKSFMAQGRLFYLGAGTSGRLGVLDASECPPTFGTSPSQVQALIAGGNKAMFQAVENAEDNTFLAAKELKNLKLLPKDILVGIAASGRTPYVIGGMQYAKDIGVKTISISCNPDSIMSSIADVAITPIVGAEVITGSSRLKAGSAQKLVLNMLTTGAMIKTGKVLGNLMVDVQASNEKLRQRQIQIVIEATKANSEQAIEALALADNHCKTAIVMLLAKVDVNTAQKALAQHQGFIHATLTALERA